MFYIQIAGLLVQVMNRDDFARDYCRDYLAEAGEPNLVLRPTEQEVLETAKALEDASGRPCSYGGAEFVRLQGMLYPLLPSFQAFWQHAVLVELDGNGYAFTAPSGYGKSTHALLWKKWFSDKARIVNGDNPIFRLQDGVFYGYGTPWCGKERFQENRRAPMKGLCYLKHGESNSIRRMSKEMAFSQLLRQNQWVLGRQKQPDDYMQLLETFVEQVPVYELTCNQDVEAAQIAYEGMKHGGN